MEVQEVGRVMVRFEDREIFLTEMVFLLFATVQGEQKRIIRVIGVEEVNGAEVEGVVAGEGREKRIQKIVLLLVQLCIVNAEYLVELGACSIHFRQVEVIDNNRE